MLLGGLSARGGIVLIYLTCAGYGPSPAHTGSSSSSTVRAESFMLDNGLKVIVRPKRGSPVVTVQVWYRVGSWNEHVGIRGIAHLFEHMMFRGSEHYGPEEHSRLIQKVGGYDNAFTAEDMTVYHQTLPSAHIELPFKLEADRMRFLKLDSAVLNTEREVVKEEFRQSLNNPFSLAYIEFRKRLFPGHPYAWTPLGDMEDLDRITVEDCQDFYEAHYVPKNAVLIVSGDVTIPQIRSLAEKYFGPLRGSERAKGRRSSEANKPSPSDSGPWSSPEKRIALKLDLELPVVTLAYHIPPASHEDIPALEVLTAILSDGESSRLYRRLVRETKLAVHAMGFTLLQRDPGLYGVGAAFLPNQPLGRVEEKLREEVNRVLTDGVTAQELEKAVNQTLADEVFGTYSVDHLAQGMGESELLEGDYHRFETIIDRYRSLTPRQIQDVAVKYLSKDKEIVLVASPKKFNWVYYIVGLFKSFADFFMNVLNRVIHFFK